MGIVDVMYVLFASEEVIENYPLSSSLMDISCVVETGQQEEKFLKTAIVLLLKNKTNDLKFSIENELV
jgi:hypothetical protein